MSARTTLLIALLSAFTVANAGGKEPGTPGPTPTPVISEPTEISRRLPDNEFMWRGCKSVGIPIVSFVVNADGTTSNHRVLRTSGCASADRIFISFVRRFWRYAPGRVNGVPVSTEVTVTITAHPS